MMSLSKRILTTCLTCLCCMSFVNIASAANDQPFGERSLMSTSNIAERVKRTGEVCLEGEDCAGKAMTAPAEEVAGEAPQVAAGPRTGDVVYNNACLGCHVSGAAGAPKVGDKADWQARVDAKGVEGVMKSGWAGIGAMPAKGMCMDCSEEEFSSAVQYMLDQTL